MSLSLTAPTYPHLSIPSAHELVLSARDQVK